MNASDRQIVLAVDDSLLICQQIKQLLTGRKEYFSVRHTAGKKQLNW